MYLMNQGKNDFDLDIILIEYDYITMLISINWKVNSYYTNY